MSNLFFQSQAAKLTIIYNMTIDEKLKAHQKSDKIGELIILIDQLLNKIYELDTEKDNRIKKNIIIPLRNMINGTGKNGFTLIQWLRETFSGTSYKE